MTAIFTRDFFKKHSGNISDEEIDFWVRVCNQHVAKQSRIYEMLGAQARINRLQKQLEQCKEQRDFYAEKAGISDSIGDDQELEAIK